MKTIVYALAVMLLPLSSMAQTEDWTVTFTNGSHSGMNCPITLIIARTHSPTDAVTNVIQPHVSQLITMPTWVSNPMIGDLTNIHIDGQSLQYPLSSIVLEVSTTFHMFCGCSEYKIVYKINYANRTIEFDIEPTGVQKADPPCGTPPQG